MPPIIRVPGQIGYRGPVGNLVYEYPMVDNDKLDLKPGSELHNRIVNNVMNRAQDSYSKMDRRHATWRKLDQNLTAYITLDEEEKALKAKDDRRPVSIVVPYSYATLETLLTYLVSAFLDNPYFRYEGVTEEDTVGSMMLEKVVEMQALRFKTGLSLHTMFRDSLIYGFGAVSPIWAQKSGWRTFRDKNGLVDRKEGLLYEGNKVLNIDPYLYLPDPSVPIHDPQRGEYIGWLDQTNYISLLESETTAPEGKIFNVKYLKAQDGRSCLLSKSTGRETKFGGDIRGPGDTLTQTSNPVDVVYQYVNLVPNDEEWKLSSKDEPEKWLFGVAADSIVIMAQPINLDHDMYPVTVCAPDFDGYSISPIGRLELVYGLQGVLDFLFSSHIANVRKAINDMLIVDPYLVNMNDLSQPGPAKLIRMRRAVWGRGVQNAVQQLAITDITKNHMQDVMNVVIPLMQGTSSAVDSLMGVMKSSGERVSATQARDTRMSALSRLAKAARIASMMSMYDLGYMHASHTQQFMTTELYVNTMGRHQQVLQEEYGFAKGMKVSPDQLNINYDTMIHDGTVEVGERADAWIQMFQIMSTQPAVGQGFDMVRVFRHIARMLGAKNVNDFIQKGGSLKVKTAQDAEVQAEVAKGNMKPVSQAGMNQPGGNLGAGQ